MSEVRETQSGNKSEAIRHRDDDSGVLGYGVGPNWYPIESALAIVQVLAAVVMFSVVAPDDLRTHQSQTSYLITGFMVLLALGAFALMSFIFRLERTVYQAKSEYDDLCRALASEVAESLIDVVRNEMEKLEPMHRNERIRAENVLEQMAKALVNPPPSRMF